MRYLDNIAATVVAKHLAYVELYSPEAITVTKKWLKDTGFPLAMGKADTMLITKHNKGTHHFPNQQSNTLEG